MKKMILIVSVATLMLVTGCKQMGERKEVDGSITFEPGEFKPWTNGYEDGVGITIETEQ